MPMTRSRRTGTRIVPDYDEEYYDENLRYHWRDACSVGSGGSFAGYAYTNYYGEYTTDNEFYDYAGHAYFNGSARIEDSRATPSWAAVPRTTTSGIGRDWRPLLLSEHERQLPLR